MQCACSVFSSVACTALERFILPVGAELFHEDRRMDWQTERWTYKPTEGRKNRQTLRS